MQAGLRSKTVCVSCASSSSCDPEYMESAYELGRLLAKESYTIIYGGGGIGSMGALADGALAEGGRIIGVIPKFMSDLVSVRPGLSEVKLVDDIQTRKRLMISESDAFITLPGGSGTLEELFEAITLKRLGIYLQPIIMVNTKGFFDPCVELLNRCISERFMDKRHGEMWQLASSPKAAIEAIERAPAWYREARNFARV
ncbi:MAG TPA: TIGR00730 family Rossman fold protein [Thermodesulfobacteriota bacterium]|nr:TIGR00730 family Rossman fold protein [Thermodesulfobacteriota bacterium]